MIISSFDVEYCKAVSGEHYTRCSGFCVAQRQINQRICCFLRGYLAFL